MPRQSQSSTIMPSEPSALGLALDSESLFADEVSLLNLAREEKRSFDEAFQTLQSEANLELATLLREVHISSDAPLGSAPQSSELLMRAVQCAVKHYTLQAELSSLALTDELTGLYNRRGFLCLTERQLKLVRRAGHDILLFFIDVDGLKRINDSFGHFEGDCALIRTAEVLLKTFRESDVLARLGGDEFAALAIEASGRSEAAIMARFRETLETQSAQEPRYPLSLSVGVVRFTPSTTSSIEELMLQADRAMYVAKRDQRRSSSPDAFLLVQCQGQSKLRPWTVSRASRGWGSGFRES
jgi:diguanylate cyclase (GGDEF)-like protein